MKIQPTDKSGNAVGMPIEVTETQWEIMKRTFGKRLRAKEIVVRSKKDKKRDEISYKIEKPEVPGGYEYKRRRIKKIKTDEGLS